MERQHVRPTLSTERQGKTPEELSKSQQSVNDTSSEGTSISRTTTHSDISGATDNPHSSADNVSKSEECLVQKKSVSPSDASAAESVKRARSFRQATRMRPINSDDLVGVTQNEESESDSDMDDPNLTRDGLKEYNDVVFESRSSLDDLSDDEKPKSVKKQSRYSSMPVLSVVQPQSPNVKTEQKLTKSKIKSSENVKESIKSTSWRKRTDGTNINRWSNGVKQDQGKSIPAFHDTFAKRSRENLVAKALRHPVYTVKHLSVDCESLSKNGSAKLTDWGSSEKLTKGSMNDLSHLSEDPWVKNPEPKLTGSVSAQNISSKPQKLKRRSEGNDSKSSSRENMDWMVYVNRNSLNESENQKYLSKYCTTPRAGTLTPPKSPAMKKDENDHSPVVVRRKDTNSVSSPRPVSTYDTVPDMTKVSTASSVPSIVVSATSPKLSYPDLLARHQYNRSNSTPILKKKSAQAMKHRPGSVDLEAIHDSDKIVAEMEDYMKKSENNNSPTCKFPTNLAAFKYEERENGNRHSTISTSSYESHSSTSSDGLMDTLKHKIHNWTSRVSKKLDDSDTQSGVSSVSDVRPSSMVISDEEKTDDTISKESSSETLNSPQVLRRTAEKVKKQQQQILDEDEELRTFLRQRGLGGGTIGSRMAHSLPLNIETIMGDKLRPHSACVLRDNESLSSYELSSKETTPEPQSRLSLPIMPENEALSPLPLNKTDTQQSDSGFSMQSDMTDTNSVDTSVSNGLASPVQEMELDEVDGAKSIESVPKVEEKKSPISRRKTQSESSAESGDSFYERRLSMAFDSEVFRDSAVFCEIDIENKRTVVKESPKKPRKSIRDFVQQLEEKNKPKKPPTMEVKRREPGSVIREKLQTLQQASQYSRHGSRNTSEERDLHPPKSVKDIQHSLISDRHSHTKSWYPQSNIGSINSSSTASISSSCSGSYSSSVSGPHFAVVGGGNQFMHYHQRAESEHGRESSPEVGCMRPARSLGRLDQLSNEIENLVIMKGWVRSLINKFQND